jgi:hypothetical protein
MTDMVEGVRVQTATPGLFTWYHDHPGATFWRVTKKGTLVLFDCHNAEVARFKHWLNVYRCKVPAERA